MYVLPLKNKIVADKILELRLQIIYINSLRLCVRPSDNNSIAILWQNWPLHFLWQNWRMTFLDDGGEGGSYLSCSRLLSSSSTSVSSSSSVILFFRSLCRCLLLCKSSWLCVLLFPSSIRSSPISCLL
jgi:hypothetical protein